MESVKRISVLWPVGPYGYGREQVVLASEFDRVSAENLALQQRLTVQDQRVDGLKELLTHAHIAIHTMTPGFFLLEKIDAALKPTAEAESHEA